MCNQTYVTAESDLIKWIAKHHQFPCTKCSFEM